MNKEGEKAMENKTTLDKWIMAVPENAYDPCPCGCGTKMKFVIKGGEKTIEEHFEKFKKMKEKK